MTSPFTDYCIYCDQLISTNENVLYYTRTSSEIEKFHKQLYCSEKCKFSDEHMKLAPFKNQEIDKEYQNMDSYNRVENIIEIENITENSSIFDKYSYRKDFNIDSSESRGADLETLLTSPLLVPSNKIPEYTNNNNNNNNSSLSCTITNKVFFSELKSTYSYIHFDESPRMTNFLNDVYGSIKNQSEYIAENNYSIWLSEINE
ncbi:uncharacterized protein KABA2_05S07920 [Maudiozyma barnettii]|uniref:Uncharacterized protein n=1 Tax=Maudiozyma barnettii TaxID=61262 RepID=A0A8H2VGM6_9SACH|nr:uncharacterized protein KABA2_05S07920 [Kazachstania barnettii]CAB4255081.1 similar to Saccharomyces cerevisiae YGR146C ECL1 Protein of unknown function, affects chronological lifespan [Kazachstania barnettii]